MGRIRKGRAHPEEMTKEKDQFIEGYRLIKTLGSGGMGTVYLARDEKSQAQVAIKILHPSMVKKAGQVDRLLREAELVRKLDHPNIVKGIRYGVSEGYHYFIMEYVKGKSVKEMLNKGKVFSEEEALKITIPVVEALQYASKAGIIHRDIKPGNIVLGEEGSVKITDLGLAKESVDSTLTRSGATVGTPQYISPEQAKDPRDVDIRTDIYSLGVTLYHMVTGEAPFEGESIAQVVAKVLYEEPVSPKKFSPSLSRGFCTILERMMEKDRALRYSSPEELLRDLRSLEAGRPIQPRKGGEVLEEKEGKRSLTFWAGTLLLILVGVLAAGYFILFHEEESLQNPPVEKSSPDPLLEVENGAKNFKRGEGILWAMKKYAELSQNHPEKAVRREALKRLNLERKDIEERIDRCMGQVETDVQVLLGEKAFLEARRLVHGQTGLLGRWEREFGAPFSSLPGDLQQRFNDQVRQKEENLDSRISQEAFQETLHQIEKSRGGKLEDFNLERERQEELEKMLEEIKLCLTPVHFSTLEGEMEKRKEEGNALARAAFQSAEAEVKNLLKEDLKRFKGSKEILERLSRSGAVEFVENGLPRFLDLKFLVEEKEKEALQEAEEQYWRFKEQVLRWVAQRKYEEAVQEGRVWLNRYSILVQENPLLEALVENYRVDLKDLEWVEQLWKRAEERLRGKVGQEMELLFQRDYSKKEILKVEGGIVQFQYLSGGPPKERFIRELEVEAVVDLGRGEEVGEVLGEGMFLLWEAWSAADLGSQRQKSLLERAAETFNRLGSREETVRYRELVDALREEISTQKIEIAREFQQLLEEVRRKIEEKLYEEAREILEILKSDGRFKILGPVKMNELDFLEKEMGRAEREEVTRSLFKGKVTFLAERRNRIRLEYSFQSPEELQDWEFDKNRWKLENGALTNCGGRIKADFGDDRNLFKEEIGLRHKIIPRRAIFSLERGFSIELEYCTSGDYDPHFFALSIYGNNLGIFTPRKYPGQVNFFQGRLEDYEEWFHKENALEPVPPGLKKGFRFEQGRSYSIRVETGEDSRRGVWMRVYVDNKEEGERRFNDFWGKKKGDFHLEIRTWNPQRYKKIALEGELEMK